MITLLIDIGNTRTKIALYNHGVIMIRVPLEKITTKDIQLIKDEYPGIKGAILSTVRERQADLAEALQEAFPLFIELDHSTPTPIENCYETPKSLGLDRLAAAIGANSMYPDTNLLVIDAGTAITYEVINSKNQYLGGNISPGLNTRFKSLHEFTGKLPLIKAGEEEEFFGKNTEQAIRLGVQQGIINEIDGVITHFNKSYPDNKVILTGGDANFFVNKLKNSIFVEFDLIEKGLNRILEYNAQSIN